MSDDAKPAWLVETAAELKQRCAENRAAREVKPVAVEPAAVEVEPPIVRCFDCEKPGACFEDAATGRVRCAKCERRRHADAADAA